MRDMKLLKLSVYFFMFLMILQVSLAAIYLGTCEGYVFYQNGSLATGAFVDVEVNGCSEACTGNYTSDAGGYYVVANLNMDAGDSVDASATLNNNYGENSGVADSFQAAYINITMCEAPYPPKLINPPGDTHNNSYFEFDWISGIDPNGLSTHDDFLFNGVVYSSVIPSQIRENLVPFKVYNWGVRTCNAGCCSNYNMSSFDLYNGIPPQPIPTDQPNTNNNVVNLSWVSGGPDPDGDAVYFDYRFDGDDKGNVTSPQTETDLDFGSYLWCVRACDPWECSNWACDAFSVINNPPSQPSLVDQGNTDASSVSLGWTSGVDPDADATYDQFEFDGVNYGNVSSPQVMNLNGTSSHVWRVRTCDNYGACSSWVSDSFIRCECGVCPAVQMIEEIIRRGGGSYCPPGYSDKLFVNSPFNVITGEDFLIRIRYKSGSGANNFRVEVLSPVEGISIEDYNYGELPKNEEVSFDLRGKVEEPIDAKTYQMTVILYNGDKVITAELFDLTIATIEEMPIVLEECKNYCEEVYCDENYCEQVISKVEMEEGVTAPREILKWIVIALTIALGLSGVTAGYSGLKFIKLGEDMLAKRFRKSALTAGLIFVSLVIALFILLWIWL